MKLASAQSHPVCEAGLIEGDGNAPTMQPGDLMRQLLSSSPVAQAVEAAQIITGHLQGIDDEGRILFLPEPGDGPAVPVAIGVAISDGELVPAARHYQRALVVRTSEAVPRLILVGLVRERVAAVARDAEPGKLEVKVDGGVIRLTAETEIELKCGNASLTLRRSGRVILKGTHVVTASSGPIKIKGATVALN